MTFPLTDFPDVPYSDWCSQPIHSHLEVTPQSKFSGISGCSDMSQGSGCGTPNAQLVLGEERLGMGGLVGGAGWGLWVGL